MSWEPSFFAVTYRYVVTGSFSDQAEPSDIFAVTACVMSVLQHKLEIPPNLRGTEKREKFLGLIGPIHTGNHTFQYK